MSWLANLDAKSRNWPALARATYAGAKWFLIAAGVYGVLGLAYDEVFRRHGIGLGTGIVVACALAVLKGVIVAFRR